MFGLKKKYTLLESTSNNLYELTDSDIEQMHQTLLGICDDLFAYCEKYSLKMVASGGAIFFIENLPKIEKIAT